MKTFDATSYNGNPTEIKLAYKQWAWTNRVFSDDTIKVTYGTSEDDFMVVTEEQYLLELAEAIREENSNDIVLSQTSLQKAMDLIRNMSTEELFELQTYIDGYIDNMVSQFENQVEQL